MTCTVQEVEGAFDLMRAAFPGYNPTIGADTAEIWHYGLQGFPAVVLVAAATRWGQTEPRFPALSEFIGACRDAKRKLNASDERALVQGTARCLECADLKMVETDTGGQGTYRPCSRCNPAGFGRWRGGHHAPDHDCEECRDLRNISRSKVR